MSLAAIANKLGVQSRSDSGEKSALCFVINKKYLLPFKVLAYSMIATDSFITLPIIVITDDREVFNDPFVRRVADVRRLVTQKAKDSFKQIVGTKVKDIYRLEWIAKYTFLKWLMYTRIEFDRLVYIDTDMVFISSVQPLLDMASDADFVCCPMFPLKDRLESELKSAVLQNMPVKYPAAPVGPYHFIHSFLDRQFSLQTARVNSGIQVVGTRLLDKNFRRSLIGLATRRAYPNEQSVITDFFKKNREYKLLFAPPAYNFKVSYLDRLPTSLALDVLPKIANLHYIGAAKPWMIGPGISYGLGHTIWWKYATEVRKARRIFSLRHDDLALLDGEVRPGGELDEN